VQPSTQTPPLRRVRTVRFALGLLAGVVVLGIVYAAAGYWLAPRYLDSVLRKQAQAAGLELRSASLRTNPFKLTVEIASPELRGADAKLLASAKALRVDLAWASLWRGRWELQSAVADQPVVELQVGPGGTLSWPSSAGAGGASASRALLVRSFEIRDGRVHVIDRSRGRPAEISLEPIALKVVGLSTSGGEPAQYTLRARLAAGGELTSEGRFSLPKRSAAGSLGASGVPLNVAWTLALPAGTAAQGVLDAATRFSWTEGRFELQQAQLKARDFSYPIGEGKLELQTLEVAAARQPNPPPAPVQISATARAKAGGAARAHGTLGTSPLAADLRLDVADIALTQAQSWLPPDVGVEIASGTLAGEGRLRLAAAGSSVEPVLYEGSISLQGLKALEAQTGNPLLGWDALQAPQARLTAHSFEAAEVIAKAPNAHLVLGEDGKLNFAHAFGGSNDAGRPRFRVSMTRLRVDKGKLEFDDRSLGNPFAVTVHALEGSVAGFDTAPGEAARVELSGRVDRYGLARITGMLNLDAPRSLTDIRATLRNLDLEKLSPYAAKFAGYRIEEGRLDARLRYRLRSGRIVGDNQLAIQDLRLGEKVRRAGARDLPIELAVALLTDPQGRIDVAIPVQGDLTDPKFDVGALIREAIGNALGKLVSAPFRALSTLLGGKAEDLGALRFEPGSVEVTPPMQESLEKLARVLSERPALQVEIHGGYDREADAAAMRRYELRREIAQRAGMALKGNEDPGPLELSRPPVLHAAERLFAERGGSRAELEKLRERGSLYGRALFERLAATVAVDSDTTQALAQARAYTVQAELAVRGIDADRLRVVSPSSRSADGSGVPTTLDISS
jgi:hypothetical protein